VVDGAWAEAVAAWAWGWVARVCWLQSREVWQRCRVLAQAMANAAYG
jgi:hypothetical protein